MNATSLFGMQFTFSLVLSAIIAKWYVAPALNKLPVHAGLVPPEVVAKNELFEHPSMRGWTAKLGCIGNLVTSLRMKKQKPLLSDLGIARIVRCRALTEQGRNMGRQVRLRPGSPLRQ